MRSLALTKAHLLNSQNGAQTFVATSPGGGGGGGGGGRGWLATTVAGGEMRGRCMREAGLALPQPRAMAHFFLFLLFFCYPTVSGQQGFLSLDCGGGAGIYSDPATNIWWRSDVEYIFGGMPGSVQATGFPGTSVVGRELSTLRYFPASSSPAKNCYDLASMPGNVYLVRAGFFYGNYDSLLSPSIHFQIAIDSTAWQNVSMDTSSQEVPVYYEAIIKPASSNFSVCLLRRENGSCPFMNSLEIRELPQSSYDIGLEGVNLYLVNRANFGGTTSVRYPYDALDRIWSPYLQLFPDLAFQGTSISVAQPMIGVGCNSVPSAVMQTAITGHFLTWSRAVAPVGARYVSFLYFAELDGSIPAGDGWVMDVEYNSRPEDSYLLNLTGLPPFQTDGFCVISPLNGLQLLDRWTTTLSSYVSSTLKALINADELYVAQQVADGTNQADVAALLSLKHALGFQQWVGDPCLPISWDELGCTGHQVTSLILSHKNLSGLVPSAIGSLQFLTHLDLSNNHFTGPFPSWVSNLQLQMLDVSNNELSGAFPASLITQLGQNFRYSGNALLVCVPDNGDVCPPQPVYAPLPLPPAGAAGSGGGSKGSSGRTVGVIVGSSIGTILVVGAAVVITYVCCFWLHAKRGFDMAASRNLAMTQSLNSDAAAAMTEATLPIPVPAGKSLRRFSLPEIQSATSIYARQIGAGGFGPVYYGVLDDQREVAVKFASTTSRQGYQEFVNEIDVLSTVYHRNLVSMIGYCQSATELILIYEYMSGGNLQRRLYGSGSSAYPLNWRQRLQIALDAARGLEYLHSYCKPAIIHRDVKTSNILLTNSLEAKITDFGFSKLTPEGADHVTTVVRGTKGYLDPEYSHTGMLTDKSDVYSFGVVMLEILSGKAPLDEAPDVPPEKKFIVHWVRAAINTGDLRKIVDPLLSYTYSMDAAWKFLELAMTCVDNSSARRPCMKQLVRELTEVQDIELRS